MLGEAGAVVRAVEFLQAEIDAVGEPSEDGVVFDEVVEDVAVDNEDVARAGGEGEFFDDGDAKEVETISAGPSWLPTIQTTSILSERCRIWERTFQWCLLSRRKSMESKTSPLMMRLAEERISLSRICWRKAVTGLAWQFSARAEVEVGDDDGVEEAGGGVGIVGEGRRGEEFGGKVGGKRPAVVVSMSSGRDHSTFRPPPRILPL